jgi:hypothetical protein
MAHHLKEPEVKLLLQEAWRRGQARGALCVISIVTRACTWRFCCCFASRITLPSFKADALLSVKRGWRKADLARLAAQAGVESATGESVFRCSRVVLEASKRAVLIKRQRSGLCFPDLVGLRGMPEHGIPRVDDAGSPFRQLPIIHRNCGLVEINTASNW